MNRDQSSMTAHDAVAVRIVLVVSAYRYIAITNLPIIPVFVEYLGQFLIDFNQIYSHSIGLVCHKSDKTRLCEFLELFSSSGFRARRRRDFFCHGVRTTVWRIRRLPHVYARL